MKNSTKNIVYIVGALVIIGLIILLMYTRMNSGTANQDQNATTTLNNSDSGNVANATNNANNTNSASNGTASTNNQVSSGSTANNSVPSLENNTVLAMVIGNALIHVPQTGTDVALSAGGADYSDSNGRVQGHIEAGPILGWAKTDNGYDVFTDMTITKNGQPQVLHYVALFYVISQTNVKYTSSVLIGDRLPVKSITVAADPSKKVSPSTTTIMSSSLGYLLTINYSDRKNGEPLTATPSLAKNLVVHVINHIVGK